jgi:hypothetical protein
MPIKHGESEESLIMNDVQALPYANDSITETRRSGLSTSIRPEDRRQYYSTGKIMSGHSGSKRVAVKKTV